MSILDELKSETRPEHDSIESTLNLMDPSMDEDKYKKILKGFYGYYKTVEELLRSRPEIYPEERWKLSTLENDLNFFNIKSESISAISSEEIPHKSLEDLLGLIYVIEGSTLGGQVLSQHFQKKFALAQNGGLSFFSGYGPQTMNKWKETKSRIEDLVQNNHLNHSALIEAAKASFSSLENWLGKSI